MESISRRQAVKRNFSSAIVGIFVNILYSFVSRKVFVMTLGNGLVGLSSLMGNIAVVLSLLDFGAGAALVYRLYAPIANKDTRRISAYLSFFRKLCFLSSVLTLLVGALLMPYIAKTSEDAHFSCAVFSIYLVSNAVGYFFCAERILLFADQKNYIAQIFSYIFGGVCVIAESAVLFVTKSYIIYLVVHTLLCVIEEVSLCIYVRFLYPEIRFFGVKDKNACKTLLKEMLYVQPKNIAETVSRTADNFLVVHLFGVATNGIYSNYNMLIGYAAMLSSVLTSSVAATVGNIENTETKERAEKLFRLTGICSFFTVAVCTSVLFVLSRDIVTLWLDKESAGGTGFSFIIAISFFVSGLKRSVAVFREGFGLYRKERLKPFLELSSSLILSFAFGRYLGLSGVYLGQAVSAFVFSLWYEPYMLYRFGFEKSVLPYYRIMIKYFVIAALSCYCALTLCRGIPFFSLKVFVCVVLTVLFCTAGFWDDIPFESIPCIINKKRLLAK